MKSLILILALSFFTITSAQDFTKDTIQLNNVDIKRSKKRVVSTKLSSFCSYICDLRSEHVTLVDKLPEGFLKSVSFKFNSRGMGMGDYKHYQTTTVEILFYEVNANNTPGERINHSPAVLTVDKDFHGKMVIDVSKLNIKNQGKIFIGLRRVNPANIKKYDFVVDGICGPKEEYTSYFRANDSGKWYRDKSMPGLKMTIKLEQL